MKKVVFYNEIIRPGGGPSGYLFGLQAACKRVTTRNKFNFSGFILENRDSNKPDTWPLWLKAKIYLQSRGILLPCFAYNKLWDDLDQADVAVIHGPIHPSLMYKIKKITNKVVFMPHSPSTWADEYVMDYSGKGRRLSKRRYEYFRWAEHTCMAYADNLVFPSKHAIHAYKHAYKDIISLQKHYFIPSGVEIDVSDAEVYSARSRTPSVFRIGFLGRFNKHKGFDLFCEAAKHLACNRIEFICGGNDGNVVMPPVRYLGWISEVKKFLLDIDIIVVPNRVAYYDLLPLEAAACGCPIVFTPAGGNLDQAKVIPDSIIASSISISGIIDAISKAIKIKSDNPSWGLKNRKIFVNHFTSENLLKRWDDFIDLI